MKGARDTLQARACIGIPIGLLISPSARTFTLSGRCARVKRSMSAVDIAYVYMYNDIKTNSLPIESSFNIAQICSLSNEKSLRGRVIETRAIRPLVVDYIYCATACASR